ncbi:MAG: DUF4358 domain-containing protein [Oscillospiraceae bacterium]
MKKFLSLAAVLAALTLTVTACSKDNADSSAPNSSTSEAATSSDVNSETTNSETTGSEADSGTSSDAATSEVNSDTSAENSDNGASDNESAELDAYSMAANAMSTIEWPAMMEVADAETAELMLGIDLAMCEDYYISTQMMSVHLNEVIIIKPTAGSEDAVQQQLDEHFEYIKNGAAFYPAQEISAAGAVMGKTDSGYLYIIVHENGADAEAALLNNPAAEMPAEFARAE